MDKKFNFTKKALEKLPNAVQKQSGKSSYDTYYDTGQSNLCLLVTDKGHKTFYVRRTSQGKSIRFKLGRFPDLSLEKARKKTDAYVGKIADGKDAEEARLKDRDEMSFKEFFHEYLEKHSKVHKKSWKYDEEQFQRHLENPLGDKKLSKIRREDIEAIFFRLTAENGKSTANHLLALITVVYNKAVAWQHFPMDRQIPTKYIKKHKEKSRERFLIENELPRFFEALENEKNETFRDFVKMSLYTGARKSNVLAMKWSEINWNRKEWHIVETKNGESHVVPLVTEAYEILQRRKGMHPQWVFPSIGEKGYFADPKRAWQRLLQAAEIENLTMHDLRRTLGSWQTITGASPFIVGKSLGHKSLKSTQVYARLSMEPVRNSLELAMKAMLGAKNNAE